MRRVGINIATTLTAALLGACGSADPHDNSVDCTRCHLTTALDTGAHGSHVKSGALAGGFGCDECHPQPADSAHSTQPLSITFGRIAATGGSAPVYDSVTKTCSGVYCHGPSTPKWGSSGTGLSCESCHANPPSSSRHAGVVAGPASCNACHGWTVAPGGEVIVPRRSSTNVTDTEYGGRHVNGVAEGHHPWTGEKPPGHGSSGANIDFDACSACHRVQMSSAATPPDGAHQACNYCHQHD